MIYSGTSADGIAPSRTGVGTIIGSYKFNNSKNYAEYVGYQYTLGERNGHTTDSNAKTELEKWFAENLMEEYEEGYIDKNAGFCGDRTTYRRESSEYIKDDTLGIGNNSNMTYYGVYLRVQTFKPTFLCEDKEHDLYTVQGASEGTQSLEYPIGLISVDELMYAGNKSGSSNNNYYYLTNNQQYWTMSPWYYFGRWAMVGNHDNITNGFTGTQVDNINGYKLRPVLNLVSGSLTKGRGTATDPFRIS